MNTLRAFLKREIPAQRFNESFGGALVGCLVFAFCLVRTGVWCVGVYWVGGRLWAKCGHGKIFSPRFALSPRWVYTRDIESKGNKFPAHTVRRPT